MTTDQQNFAFKSAVKALTADRNEQQPGTSRDARSTHDLVRELPPPGAMRWGVRRKAAVVNAVRTGVLSLDEACQRYALSVTEYLSWETGLDAFGPEGLGLEGRQKRRRAATPSEK